MKTSKYLLAACALALAGITAATAAPAIHRMTVNLPNGGTAQVTYTGDVAPKIAFSRDSRAMPALFAGNPFAAMQRISAEMDRQMLQMQAMFRDPVFVQPRLDSATLRTLPQGASGYSFVSTVNGGCMQSVEITQTGNSKPEVVRRTSGNCDKANGKGTAAAAGTVTMRPDVTQAAYRTETLR